jgi:membrane associated rhomboid family serine protease
MKGPLVGRDRMHQTADSFAGITRDVRRHLTLIVSIIGMFWLVAIVNMVLAGSLLQYGVIPRTARGLIGIPLHPFLHVGFRHVLLNSVGFFVLGGLVILRDARDFWMATVLGTIVGGLGIWLVGRTAVHVGASGVIFAHFGYLMTTGWFDRRIGAIVLSLVVFLVWGSLFLGVLPGQVEVSWEGHLFGLMGGVATAWMRGRRVR